jgi:three-Cys-motif partner protein
LCVSHKRPKKERLFEVGKPEPKQVGRKRHLHALDDPSEQVHLPARDGLVPALVDGLPARLVKTHSANKARMVRRDLGTVSKAMSRQWFEVHYLELFAGPGLLLDDVTGEEVPGSPLEALSISRPFDHYVFSDYAGVCTSALRQRIDGQFGPRPDVDVLRGDANDPAHLERVCSHINPRALVIAYLDPAKPNLHFETVRFLAQRFRFIDFIINLPFSGIHRSLAAGGEDKPRLMLNHPNPLELLHRDEGRTAENIRAHYDAQLHTLGLHHRTRRCVRTAGTNSSLYDIVLASRHPRAIELWDKANIEPKPPAGVQLGFGDAFE